jgi:hypothetical protein
MRLIVSFFVLGALAAAILAGGCISSVTTTTPTATPTPYEVLTPPGNTLLGNWTGTMVSYDEGTGYADNGNRTMSMAVTGEKDRLFSGTMVIQANGTVYTVPIAGIMAKDRQSFVLVEKNFGYVTGTFVNGNEIELDWHNDGPEIGVAIDTLQRV